MEHTNKSYDKLFWYQGVNLTNRRNTPGLLYVDRSLYAFALVIKDGKLIETQTVVRSFATAKECKEAVHEHNKVLKVIALVKGKHTGILEYIR
jgi:hypothetical protein